MNIALQFTHSMSQLNTHTVRKSKCFENSILRIEKGNETITTVIGIQTTKLKKWLVVYIITQQHDMTPILTMPGDICDVLLPCHRYASQRVH